MFKKCILLLFLMVIFTPVISTNEFEIIPNALCEDPDNCYPVGGGTGLGEFTYSKNVYLNNNEVPKSESFTVSSQTMGNYYYMFTVPSTGYYKNQFIRG